MKASLVKYWERLRSSVWFLPSLMAGGALALAYATVALDQAVTDEWLRAQSWAYTGGAEGASVLLGSVAGSMIRRASVPTLIAFTVGGYALKKWKAKRDKAEAKRRSFETPPAGAAV